MDSQAF